MILKLGQAQALTGNCSQPRLMRIGACLLVGAFQDFLQSVQLILEPTEFGLLHPQSIFGFGYRCLDFSLFIRVRIEPYIYLGEDIFEVLLFRCRRSLRRFFSSICLIEAARLLCSVRT